MGIKCLIFIILLCLLSFNTQAYMLILHRGEEQQIDDIVLYRCIIVYDELRQKVWLVPQITFIGEPKDFCIVAATPSEPELLEKTTQDIFYEAEVLTSPIRRERGVKCWSGGDFLGSDKYEKYEERLDISADGLGETSVEMSDPTTFSNSKFEDLIKWLDEHNYKYTANDKSIIDYYGGKGWAFTVVEPIASTSTESNSSSGVEIPTYSTNPIIFLCDANSLIYPVRLTPKKKIIDDTDVTLYVISAHKMVFSGTDSEYVEYANQLDDKELENIKKFYPNFGGLITQKSYLTKLKRTFSITEMTDEDIEIKAPDNNEEFRKVIYYGVSSAVDFIPLGMAAVLFLVFRMLVRRKSDSVR